MKRKNASVPGTWDENPKEWMFMHKITSCFCLNASISHFVPTIIFSSMETKEFVNLYKNEVCRDSELACHRNLSVTQEFFSQEQTVDYLLEINNGSSAIHYTCN